MKKLVCAVMAAFMILLLPGCDSKEENTDPRDYVDVPVLMYHSIGYVEDNSYVVTPEKFRHQMELLKENGYTTVTFDELINYVESGTQLPDKPVAVTFDDGYLDNYQYAYPILKELGMKATINVIGVMIGADTYKDTGVPIMPHFGLEEGREMEESGVIDLQMHSYDMHQSELDQDYRFGTSQKDGESNDEYKLLLERDTELCKNILMEGFGLEDKDLYVYAYPQGAYNQLSEEIMGLMGVKVTLTVTPGMNRVEKGNGESLTEMKRFDVYSTMDDEEFLYDLSLEYVDDAGQS